MSESNPTPEARDDDWLGRLRRLCSSLYAALSDAQPKTGEGGGAHDHKITSDGTQYSKDGRHLIRDHLPMERAALGTEDGTEETGRACNGRRAGVESMRAKAGAG